jgi:hypothetical protein
MFAFLGRHVGEDFGARGIVIPQTFSEIGINAAIFLLAADGQSKKLALGQFREAPHHARNSQRVEIRLST